MIRVLRILAFLCARLSTQARAQSQRPNKGPWNKVAWKQASTSIEKLNLQRSQPSKRDWAVSGGRHDGLAGGGEDSSGMRTSLTCPHPGAGTPRCRRAAATAIAQGLQAGPGLAAPRVCGWQVPLGVTCSGRGGTKGS